jgi:hypothetical protein
MARKLGTVAALVLALALPAGAQAVVLHDQTDQLGFYSNPSDDYATSQDALDNQLADDFTVPPGQRWQISRIDLIGTDDGPVPQVVNAWIYASAGTLPGAQRFQQLGIAATNYPNYVVPLSGAPGLDGPATYWISVQQTGAFYSVPTWAWRTRAVQDGNPAAFRNPGGGYVAGMCLDWTAQSTCFPSSAPDLAWSISGTNDSIPVTFGKLHRNARNGTAVLTVTVAAAGTLELGGKGVKASSAQIAARTSATKVTLKIRTAGKAKKKLNASGKATVKAKVTYTASGASPATSTRKIKLTKRP